METPSTKSFAQMVSKVSNGARKSLFVLPDFSENVYKSFRNIPSVCGTLLSDINTYDIVNADTVILTESAAMIFVDSDDDADVEVETPVKAEPKPKKEKAEKKEAKVEEREVNNETKETGEENAADDSGTKEETTE